MNLFLLILVLKPSIDQQLKKTRSAYEVALSVEPSFVEKGKAYLALSVINIRLNELEKALSEAKKAAYYDRKDEAIYLQGVINYLKGDIEKAISNFNKINNWQYTCFLENLYSLSIDKKILPEVFETLSDSLSFRFIFYEEDTTKIAEQIEKSNLPLWQNFLGRGYLCYKRNKYRRALNYFIESYKIRPIKYTGVYVLSSLFQLSEYDSLISFQKRNSITSPLANYLKGEAFYKKGEKEKAVEIFLSDTNSQYKTHALFGAGWSKYQLAMYSESANLFERFLEVYEGKELKQYALYRLARALLKQGRIESLNYFKKIIKEFPDSPLKDDAYLLLGKINFLLNNNNKAIKWLSALLREFPNSNWAPSAYKFLAEIFANKKDFDAAQYYYERLLSLAWAPADLLDEARYKIEEIKWEKGEYPTKINMFKTFIEKYPESQRAPSLLLKIAEYYQAAKRYNLSIRCYNKILSNHPKCEEANESLLQLVKIYQKLGNKERAIELLEKGLQERKTISDEINLKLGEIYYEDNELKKAIEHYGKVTSKELLPQTLYQISSIYQELGLFKEARIPLENIIKNFPESENSVKAYLLLAKTYLHEGSLKSAIEILDKGLEKIKKEKTGSLFSFKADIYCEVNDEGAIDLYLKSANVTPDTKKKIKILEKGKKCAVRLNKPDKVQVFDTLIHNIKFSTE